MLIFIVAIGFCFNTPATINKIMPEVTILICDSHIGVISGLVLNRLLANRPDIPHITQANPAKRPTGAVVFV